MILALDQGTTSSRAILFDHSARIISLAQKELTQIFPKPGWVEHDPIEIWNSQMEVARESLAAAPRESNEIKGIGITNQRETTLIWDRESGTPIHNALVWQDRRTSGACEALKEAGHADLIKTKTGLPTDSYFSATKVAWLLDQIEGARERAENGELAFGTIDCWLIWNLTEGECHVTDVSNASRTMLLNLETLDWDPELLDLMRIPRSLLPEVRSSSEVYGQTAEGLFPEQIPIAGIAGDQQAALFG
ncbi:MAG: FGGY family carbohydrate kinase, partial [Verrucomicrobiota bacterium]